MSSAGSQRMQMRVVSFETIGEVADRERDLDAETLWCREVSELGSDLAIAGTKILIERSSPIGATPLKRIAVAGASDTLTTDIRPSHRRTLP